MMSSLVSNKNVNLAAIDKMTPYSWILKGKIENEDSDSGIKNMLLESEKILLRNGADPGLALAGLKEFV